MCCARSSWALLRTQPAARALGAVTEPVLSALYAPIMMIIQVRQLSEILLGQDSGWSVQRRGTADALGDMVRRHWLQTRSGIALRRAAVPVSTLVPLDVADTPPASSRHPVVASER